MKKLFANDAVYEVLLTLYFSDKKELCLGSQMIGLLDGFTQYCLTEDKFYHTKNCEQMKKVYSNPGFCSRDEILKHIAFSETTLYRFRTKTIQRLKRHLKNAVFEEDEIPEVVMLSEEGE